MDLDIRPSISSTEAVIKLSYQEELDKLNKKDYSTLEWSVLNNSYNDTLKHLEKGDTIFVSTDKICSGGLQRRNIKHPPKCKKDLY